MGFVLFLMGVVCLPAFHQKEAYTEDHDCDRCPVCAVAYAKSITTDTIPVPLYAYTAPRPVISVDYIMAESDVTNIRSARAPPYC